MQIPNDICITTLYLLNFYYSFGHLLWLIFSDFGEPDFILSQGVYYLKLKLHSLPRHSRGGVIVALKQHQKNKTRPLGLVLFFYLVAEAGFEPTTFGLWARRATKLLHSAILTNIKKHGAGDRTWTGTSFTSQDFKSCASADFATPAATTFIYFIRITQIQRYVNSFFDFFKNFLENYFYKQYKHQISTQC